MSFSKGGKPHPIPPPLATYGSFLAILIAKQLSCDFQVEVTQQHLYQSSHDSFTKVGGGLKLGFAGLFNISGGADREKGTKSLTKEGSNLKISFKIRKVSIRRPWFETAILQYPTIGIKGLPACEWSTGELDPSKNKGKFPLLPTDMVLAKDIMIRADSIADKVLKCISSGENTSMVS